MTDVSKHNAKEEGKCYASEECRVYLFIAGNSICINDFLER